MDKLKGVNSFHAEPGSNKDHKEASQVNIAAVLSEISENLFALADLAEELSTVPPEKLQALFQERESLLMGVLASFGLSLEDLEEGKTLN